MKAMSAPSTMDVAETQLGSELEAVLSETPLDAQRREATAFDELCDGRDIVIFGAGNLGRRIRAYQKQDRLWAIPLAIHELLPSSQVFLRPHCADGLDVVCYAILAGRSVRGWR